MARLHLPFFYTAGIFPMVFRVHAFFRCPFHLAILLPSASLILILLLFLLLFVLLLSFYLLYVRPSNLAYLDYLFDPDYFAGIPDNLGQKDFLHLLLAHPHHLFVFPSFAGPILLNLSSTIPQIEVLLCFAKQNIFALLWYRDLLLVLYNDPLFLLG